VLARAFESAFQEIEAKNAALEQEAKERQRAEDARRRTNR
jgi:hypothetical protein